MSRTNKTEKRQHTGKLLYHSISKTKNIVGDNKYDVIEQSVTRSDEILFCKYYEKIKGVFTKIIVRSSGKGGEYIYSIKNGSDPTDTATYKKTELLTKLKKDDRLDFIVKYIKDSKDLSRSLKNKTKSKTRKLK